MKLVERASGLYLEEIVSTDLRFANLAGRMTGSMYDDPDKPKHEYVVWITDPEILDIFRNLNVNIGVKEIEHENVETEVKYSIKFKAYPKIRVNRVTAREEQYPKVVLKTLNNMVRLNSESFGLVDSANIEKVDIKFHPWQYDRRSPNCVAVIDELWVQVNEGAGERDESYLDEKWGYVEEDNVEPADDEI